MQSWAEAQPELYFCMGSGLLVLLSPSRQREGFEGALQKVKSLDIKETVFFVGPSWYKGTVVCADTLV